RRCQRTGHRVAGEGMSERKSAVSVADVNRFIAKECPQLGGFDVVVAAVGPGFVRLRMPISERILRPGGTVGGPAIMTLCDAGVYFAVFTMLGVVPLAVTTSLNINFLRLPQPRDI